MFKCKLFYVIFKISIFKFFKNVFQQINILFVDIKSNGHKIKRFELLVLLYSMKPSVILICTAVFVLLMKYGFFTVSCPSCLCYLFNPNLQPDWLGISQLWRKNTKWIVHFSFALWPLPIGYHVKRSSSVKAALLCQMLFCCKQQEPNL